MADTQDPVPPTPDEPGHPGSEYYHRGGGAAYGTADKLQALSDGYFGLGIAFVINIALALCSRLLTASSESLAVIGFALVGMFVAITLITFPFNKKIAIGKGWNTSHALLASFLMGLNSALCCGIIGYIVMQSIASTEIAKYGIPSKLFGLKKSVVQARIQEMRQAESQVTA